MKREVLLTKPGRETKFAKGTIKNITINGVKRLNNISNEDMKVRMTSLTKNLFNVNSSGKPSINRGYTFTSTGDRVRYPGIKPLLKMGKTNRGAKTMNYR